MRWLVLRLFFWEKNISCFHSCPVMTTLYVVNARLSFPRWQLCHLFWLEWNIYLISIVGGVSWWLMGSFAQWFFFGWVIISILHWMSIDVAFMFKKSLIIIGVYMLEEKLFVRRLVYMDIMCALMVFWTSFIATRKRLWDNEGQENYLANCKERSEKIEEAFRKLFLLINFGRTF